MDVVIVKVVRVEHVMLAILRPMVVLSLALVFCVCVSHLGPMASGLVGGCCDVIACSYPFLSFCLVISLILCLVLYCSLACSCSYLVAFLSPLCLS